MIANKTASAAKGFLWMFLTTLLLANLNAIQAYADNDPVLAPHENAVMIGVVLVLGVSMIVFARVMARAAVGFHRGRGNPALATGAALGLFSGAWATGIL